MSNSKAKANKNNYTTGYLFSMIANDWQKNLNIVFEKYGIDTVEYSLLSALINTNNVSATQAILGQYSRLDKMTTSKMMRVMEDKKLLKRKESKIDTRAKTVEITEKGKKLFVNATQALEKFEKSYFEKLYKSDKAINQKLDSLL